MEPPTWNTYHLFPQARVAIFCPEHCTLPISQSPRPIFSSVSSLILLVSAYIATRFRWLLKLTTSSLRVDAP